MRLLLDENVKRSIHTLLTQEGHDVQRVQDALELGVGDDELVEHCRNEERVLLTNDDDLFAFEDHPGVLFLDEQAVPPRAVATAIQRVERFLDPDTLSDTVIHVPDGWA